MRGVSGRSTLDTHYLSSCIPLENDLVLTIIDSGGRGIRYQHCEVPKTLDSFVV